MANQNKVFMSIIYEIDKREKEYLYQRKEQKYYEKIRVI